MSSYCHRCRSWVLHNKALVQRQRSSANHHCCHICDIGLPSSAALREHIKIKHFYCRICDLLFDDSDDFLEHGESDHYTCWPCARIFTSFEIYIKHNTSKHYFCHECNLPFLSEGTLTNHRSTTHGSRWLRCPGRRCKKRFLTPSGLIQHAESGGCRSGVTRKAVNEYVANQDRQNVITNPLRMITGFDGINYPPSEPEYLATELSRNGKCYECFLCRSQFKTLEGLNQHLKSPCHLQKLYHCPMTSCAMEFTVLSALCQHVEMGSCGIRETRIVQNAMEYLERGMKALSF
ncbi:uncharacterized protein FOMMEDRAFT_160073 [Fomitiporia mediterranea MF3/22]|uniref:uncharacterized protein n=1 Tax=Fomitiporia mediterranea (strain MF3/22) TaxID=694068 RepID=UPI000440753A|nr:uncharacterized protein FOMMEDRAFT_160073 [Fomitiporia mediterranea MF3/22]EJC99648.1 hypothetical protein FOMMEDRAFT_160073 [Fomitiporia mediterranea MF3/22]